ncbi:hypothetical protein [Nocardia sp. AB354]|uniref:hypothetical protein n=1 Tax=Nocardia sp. AB354 TaxID=3413283 RepID=UPI003C149401
MRELSHYVKQVTYGKEAVVERPYRLVIWGPGDMGGRALRTALESPDFEVVGVKVFSPHKHGRDIGELAGLAAVGVAATTSKDEILALNADCVVHTPTTPALIQGADADVVDLLESGKNVVSAASYHNPSMPTWLSASRSPLSVLLERHISPVPARERVRAGGTVIEPGSVGAIHMTYRGYLGDRLFMTNSECWHVGGGNAHLGPDHPRSRSGGHVITLDGTPSRIEMRNEMDDEAHSADWSAVTDISVRAMLSTIPELCSAPPGVVMPDLDPRYRLETV